MKRTYLAIVGETSGYVLDVYPHERARNLAFYGKRVVGEFDHQQHAQQAVYDAMKAKCEATGEAHHWA